MQRQTHPIHFEDFSGQQFERLCLAYFVRRFPTGAVSWYGQLGADRGRDIICEAPNEPVRVIQCANFRRLVFSKVEEDLTKLASGPRSRGALFHLICGGAVSSKLRDRIADEGRTRGFHDAVVWAGAELEENMRSLAPDILRRFFSGEIFPELPSEVVAFTKSSADLTDRDIADALATALDRPAFKTQFYQESSLPRFKAAIAETIETLNTGRTPQGTQLPSRHQIKDPQIAKKFEQLVQVLVQLRVAFDGFIRTGDIRPCGCSQPDCPVFFFQHRAAEEMDERRRALLKIAHEVSARFKPAFY